MSDKLGMRKLKVLSYSVHYRLWYQHVRVGASFLKHIYKGGMPVPIHHALGFKVVSREQPRAAIRDGGAGEITLRSAAQGHSTISSTSK